MHLDWREAHYCKILLDEIFGRECFLNEVIWAYDFGGRGKDRWPAKHDTILVYVKQMGAHLFDQDEIDRVPYLAPGLVGPVKAERGKLPDGRVVAHDRPHDGSGRRPATRPRSPRGCSAGCCSRRRDRATGCWTSSPAAVRRARWPPPSDAGSCWSTRTRRPST